MVLVDIVTLLGLSTLVSTARDSVCTYHSLSVVQHLPHFPNDRLTKQAFLRTILQRLLKSCTGISGIIVSKDTVVENLH